jgi:hypothetical protein
MTGHSFTTEERLPFWLVRFIKSPCPPWRGHADIKQHLTSVLSLFGQMILADIKQHLSYLIDNVHLTQKPGCLPSLES